MSDISNEQGELRLWAMTALNSIKDSLKSLSKNKEYILKQREQWQDKLYEIFEEFSKIMKNKLNEMDEKINKLFNGLQKFNSISIINFSTLKSRLEYYLNLTEETFELDIARANRMITPTLKDWNDLVHLSQDIFNFEECKFVNNPLEKVRFEMEKFKFVPAKNKKFKNIVRWLGIDLNAPDDRLEDKNISKYAAFAN